MVGFGKFGVNTPAFGPNKSHPAPGQLQLVTTRRKQEREGGTILSSPTLLRGELNLIAANAATKRRGAILTACQYHSKLNCMCVSTCLFQKALKHLTNEFGLRLDYFSCSFPRTLDLMKAFGYVPGLRCTT